jgi:signal peptidase
MHQTLIRRARQVVGRIGIALLVVLVAFSLFTHLAPLAGHDLFIVGGGSMEPSIPIGSLAIVTPIDASRIAAGEVVTVRAPQNVVVTHRVIRVVTTPGGRAFELKGDANASPDAGLVPATAVIGAAGQYVPLAGYAQSFLSTLTGEISVLSMLGALLLAYVLLDVLERSGRAGLVAAPSPLAARDPAAP